jgi:glycosyltransferase involved in cell wall biosynthesis
MGARAAALRLDYVELQERHSLDASVWPALVRLVRDRRIDIVHAHDYKTDLLALALREATAAIPLSTVHGWIHDSWRERRIYYPADKWLLRWFPRVIAVSSRIRSTLIDAGVRGDRITTVLNGIDADVFRRDGTLANAARDELGLKPRDIVIGAVGRLERVKRFDVLLDAFARVRERWPHARLIVVGEGDERSALENRASALGLGEACRFLGHRTDVIQLHHAFDLFVQSSDSEGTPNAVLEAMALETPVVATDAGGTRDVLRHRKDGLIVPCGDVEALAAAIDRTLTEDDARLGRVAAARARVVSELSFERRTRAIESIYYELVAARQPRTCNCGDDVTAMLPER